MKLLTLVLIALALCSCSALGGNTNGVPAGSVAWCGQFDYTGTWVKAETNGRAIGVSDSTVVARMTVDDVIKLAEALGCNRG